VNDELKIDRTGPSILFLCLARNCASTLPKFLGYLDELRRAGVGCSAIVGENGSTDSTREQIQSAGPGVTLLDTSFMDREPSRTTRMAVGRQALLDSAVARSGAEEFICIADLDQAIASPPAPESVSAGIERLLSDRSLFAIGASSRPVYYDLISLRAQGFEFLNDLCKEIERSKHYPLTYFQFHQERIYSVQEDVTLSLPLLCESSFNGFCLYVAEDYLKGSYRASDEDRVCEHVNFNLSLARGTGKRMFVSDLLTIKAPAEHIRVGFMQFWGDRLRERITGSR
jgi:hypothetical protein